MFNIILPNLISLFDEIFINSNYSIIFIIHIFILNLNFINIITLFIHIHNQLILSIFHQILSFIILSLVFEKERKVI